MQETWRGSRFFWYVHVKAFTRQSLFGCGVDYIQHDALFSIVLHVPLFYEQWSMALNPCSTTRYRGEILVIAENVTQEPWQSSMTQNDFAWPDISGFGRFRILAIKTY